MYETLGPRGSGCQSLQSCKNNALSLVVQSNWASSFVREGASHLDLDFLAKTV
jgi:hypothetical protein